MLLLSANSNRIFDSESLTKQGMNSSEKVGPGIKVPNLNSSTAIESKRVPWAFPGSYSMIMISVGCHKGVGFGKL